jgi:hypothetical protein
VLGMRVQIVRYTDDWQPGWVERQMTDSHGRHWSFIEKVPVGHPAQLAGPACARRSSSFARIEQNFGPHMLQ